MKSTMVRAFAIVSLGLVASAAPAQRVRSYDPTLILPAAEPKLRGIVSWNGQNQALIEIPGRSGRPITATLQPGERAAGCEIVDINERAGTVKVASGRPRATNELRLELKPGEMLAGRTFAFQGARLSQIIEVYQDICGRTVIPSALIPESAFNLMSGAHLSLLEATTLLDQKLAAKGVFSVPRGEKFVFLVPQSQLNLPGLLPEPPQPDAKDRGEILPAGLIRFREADSSQVLAIYAELSGRSVLQPAALRGKKISVRSQTALTRAEATWLIQAALLPADISLAAEGETFVYAVPSSRTEPLPKFTRRKGDAVSRLRGNSGSMNFIESDREEMLETYARLLGREPLLVGPEVPAFKFSFRAQQSLDREEALFALEALAALNYLRFELVGDRQVKLAAAMPAPQ